MNLVFYILIYLTAPCWNNCQVYLLPTYDVPIGGTYNCHQCAPLSSVEMKIVDSIEDILAYHNKKVESSFNWIDAKKEPNKIYRVTVENGKFSQKEIKIVPVIKKTKIVIEQEKETIEGYKIE